MAKSELLDQCSFLTWDEAKQQYLDQNGLVWTEHSGDMLVFNHVARSPVSVRSLDGVVLWIVLPLLRAFELLIEAKDHYDQVSSLCPSWSKHSFVMFFDWRESVIEIRSLSGRKAVVYSPYDKEDISPASIEDGLAKWLEDRNRPVEEKPATQDPDDPYIEAIRYQDQVNDYPTTAFLLGRVSVDFKGVLVTVDTTNIKTLFGLDVVNQSSAEVTVEHLDGSRTIYEGPHAQMLALHRGIREMLMGV